MEIEIASLKHIKYCKIISETITDSAKVRGTGIALRTPEYIETKIRNKNAIIATDVCDYIASMTDNYFEMKSNDLRS